MAKEKAESNESFDNISESLNTSFEGDLIEAEEEQVVDPVTSERDELDFHEKDYLIEELKSLISGINVTMDLLRQELKIGSPPRMYEVLGGLANSKSNALKELISMEKAKLDAKVKMKKVDAKTNGTTVNNLNLSSKDLLAMVNRVKKTNSLKEVKAEFKIGEGE